MNLSERNTTEQHARPAPTAGLTLAEHAGTGWWGLGELAELKRLSMQAGVEGLLSGQRATGRRKREQRFRPE